jgi:hypothetical protein
MSYLLKRKRRFKEIRKQTITKLVLWESIIMNEFKKENNYQMA